MSCWECIAQGFRLRAYFNAVEQGEDAIKEYHRKHGRGSHKNYGK